MAVFPSKYDKQSCLQKCKRWPAESFYALWKFEKIMHCKFVILMFSKKLIYIRKWNLKFSLKPYWSAIQLNPVHNWQANSSSDELEGKSPVTASIELLRSGLVVFRDTFIRLSASPVVKFLDLRKRRRRFFHFDFSSSTLNSWGNSKATLPKNVAINLVKYRVWERF